MQGVKEIVTQFLDNNFFDGLANHDIECGCGVDDLMPCENCTADCQPAVKFAHGFYSLSVWQTGHDWSQILGNKLHSYSESWDARSYHGNVISFEEYCKRLEFCAVLSYGKYFTKLVDKWIKDATQPQTKADNSQSSQPSAA